MSLKSPFLKSLAALIFVLCLPVVSRAQVQESVDTLTESDVIIYPGDLVTLKVYSLTRIAISDPGIVDIVNADVNEIVLVGSTVGVTPIFIWDEHGKRTIMARVFKDNLDMVITRIEKLLDTIGLRDKIKLEKNIMEGKVVVSGSLNKDKLSKLYKIIGPFESDILNLVQQEQFDDMIQVDVQITELTTTLTEAMGFDWSTGGAGLSFGYPETLPTLDGTPGDWFKIGTFSRTDAITATVTALLQEGKGRVLSRPSIVVANGQSATFLVGGEIPIRTTTSSTGGSAIQENITFTTYGVDITVVPVINEGKVQLTLSVNIRDIDAANAVGTNVAFSTRTASTKLFLDDGQTVVLAGLIKDNRGEQVKRVPYLSSIPVVGAIFRHRSKTPNAQQEVVISVVPRIMHVKKSEEKNVPKDAQKDEQGKLKVSNNSSTADLEEKLDKFIDGDKDQGAKVADTDKKSAEAEGVKGQQNKEEQKGEEATNKEATNEEVTKETQEKEKSAEIKEVVVEESIKPSDLEKEMKDLTVKKEMVREQGKLLADQKAVEAEPEAVSQDVLLEGEKNVSGDPVSDALTKYIRSLQHKISRAVSFPYEAKKNGWEGTVKLTLTILSDGTLNEVTVRESSGHAIFDKDAVNTAQILAPFDPFPAELDLEELIVTIPIVYNSDLLMEEGNGAKIEIPSPQELSEKLQKIYHQQVAQKIAEHAIYPAEARASGWEGKVLLNLKILEDGTLVSASVDQSSGYETIDQSALQLAREASPFGAFPAQMLQTDIDLTVPVIYALDKE